MRVLALDGVGQGGEVGHLGSEPKCPGLPGCVLLIEEASGECPLWCQLVHLYKSLLSITVYSVIYIIMCSIKQCIDFKNCYHL